MSLDACRDGIEPSTMDELFPIRGRLRFPATIALAPCLPVDGLGVTDGFQLRLEAAVIEQDQVLTAPAG